jgi:hypothetical protein
VRHSMVVWRLNAYLGPNPGSREIDMVVTGTERRRG